MKTDCTRHIETTKSKGIVLTLDQSIEEKHYKDHFHFYNKKCTVRMTLYEYKREMIVDVTEFGGGANSTLLKSEPHTSFEKRLQWLTSKTVRFCHCGALLQADYDILQSKIQLVAQKHCMQIVPETTLWTNLVKNSFYSISHSGLVPITRAEYII